MHYAQRPRLYIAGLLCNVIALALWTVRFVLGHRFLALTIIAGTLLAAGFVLFIASYPRYGPRRKSAERPSGSRNDLGD